jgi:hypothetical protein
MSQKLLLICFDINSSYEENKNNENAENLPESPYRIMSEYFSNHKISNLEKQEIPNSQISYKFNVDLPEVSSFNLFIINELNFIHDICMQADGYLVFINLEDENLENKLEDLIRYIKEGCSESIKIYFIGLYKDAILPSCKKENLENLFNEKNLYFEIFQVKYDMNDNFNKAHNCLSEALKKDDSNNKKKNQLNISEEKHEYKIQEIIEIIFIKLYENKMGVIYDTIKKRFIKKNSKEIENNSNSFCNIY